MHKLCGNGGDFGKYLLVVTFGDMKGSAAGRLVVIAFLLRKKVRLYIMFPLYVSLLHLRVDLRVFT